MKRLVAVMLASAALAMLGITVGAEPAAAHANLLFTAPAADSTLATAPDSVTLLFDQAVTTAGTPVQVSGPQGPTPAGEPELTHDGKALRVPLTISGEGVYRVDWQVTADDGDVMSGTYRFAVGPAAIALRGGQATGIEGAWPTAVLRAILFAALAVALGEQFGRRRLRRIAAAAPPPRRIAVWACLAGLVATIGLALMLLGNGSLGTALTQPSVDALVGRPGILALVEVAGFATATALAAARRDRAVALPLAAVIIAEALRAHPQLANPLIGIPLSAVHLAAAALWAGSLVYLLRTVTAWRQHRDLALAAVAAYARAAAWLLAVVVLTGAASVLVIAPVDSLPATDYGRGLLVKLTLVAVAAAVAVAARRLLRKRTAPHRIGRLGRVEAAALAGVIGASAVLTVLPVPASADAPLPLPPPATGPVVPAAALAGQIGVNARASSGLLVVQLFVPEIADPSGALAPAEFELAGSLSSPDGGADDLRFRRCGEGCFASTVDWERGTSRITLTPAATGWDARPAAMSFSWPAGPADELLAEAVAAMQAVPAFTLHELVTSDTTEGLGIPRSFETSGAEFVRLALYASGQAPVAARLPDENGNRRIALSYPAENAVLELTLDADGRILHELQTAPHHLVTRTLVYPDHDDQ